MKRTLLLSLIFLFSIFSQGFIKKSDQNIKGVICGSDLSIKILKNNFKLDNIHSGKPQEKIEEELGMENSNFNEFYIDVKRGDFYDLDKNSSNLYVTYMKPVINIPDTNKVMINIKEIMTVEEFFDTHDKSDIDIVQYYSGTHYIYEITDKNGEKRFTKSAPELNFFKLLRTKNISVNSSHFGRVKHTIFSKRKGNLIEIYKVSYLDGLKLTPNKEVLNLSKLNYIYKNKGKNVKDKCIFFPLPGIVEIKE